MKLIGVAGVLAGLAVFASGVPASADVPASPECDRGEFCLWDGSAFEGAVRRLDLTTINPGTCSPLPEGFDGRSFVNLGDRDVTVYQGRDCSTEGDFTTYPGGGVYVPEARFVVRGIQVWER